MVLQNKAKINIRFEFINSAIDALFVVVLMNYNSGFSEEVYTSDQKSN